ncbi:MAG: exopolysaccharide biosynthesis protein [Roseovarius sp.]|nr:exopolysaccharide biosynthesis protein [Roseovarius sp.]
MTAHAAPVRDNLMRLLDRIEAETGDGAVSVRDVLGILGPRAFTPMLLVPSLVLVSPASAVPGVPSLLSLLVGLVALQMLLGHARIWLPRVLLDRALDPARFARVMRALRRPVAIVDPLIIERLTWLADKPGNIPALVICATISFFMPLIEFVPFLTSILASAIALFATGMFARDGLFMLLGYGLVAGGAVLVTQALQAVIG